MGDSSSDSSVNSSDGGSSDGDNGGIMASVRKGTIRIIPKANNVEYLEEEGKKIKKYYIEQSVLRQARAQEKKENKHKKHKNNKAAKFDFNDHVTVIYDLKTSRQLEWVNVGHLPRTNTPDKKTVDNYILYNGLRNDPDTRREVRDKLVTEMKQIKAEVRMIIRKFLVYNCKKEGILTECSSGTEIKVPEQIYMAFRHCQNREDVKKFVNAFIIDFEKYKNWQRHLTLYLMQENGYMLDKSGVSHNKKLKDCFCKLASSIRNEEMKTLNRKGDEFHGWNITKSRVRKIGEKELPKRKIGEYDNWMIIGDGVSCYDIHNIYMFYTIPSQ